MRAKEEQMDTFGKSPCVSDISTENKSQIQSTTSQTEFRLVKSAVKSQYY